MNFALDVEHALIVLLTRLRLGEVTSSQRDWTHHPGRDQDVRCGEDLRAALQRERERGGINTKSTNRVNMNLEQKRVEMMSSR